MESKNKHESAEPEMKGGSKSDLEFTIQLIIIAVLAVLLVYNGFKLYGNSSSSVSSTSTTGAATGIELASALDIIPKGTPDIYGKELGVSFDDASASNPTLADKTMAKLSEYENAQLNKEQMERYVKIGSSIGCEYCCGAQTLVFSNGERACGCAHSYAMRGLAKYLLTKQSNMTDIAILEELGKWKVLFFPGVHQKKAEVLKASGIDYTSYINLASNLYRGIENKAASSGSSGEMVGGC